ncbi:hypothetical protein EBV26_14000 [bacterium]|nr:hypothetical protein [bacterium]
MDIQYYIQYIISWIYHNVIRSDVTYALLKIILIIGLVTLLVMREYVLFILLLIIILSSECFRWMTENNHDFGEVQKMLASSLWSDNGNPSDFSITAGIKDKDALTNGVSLSTREGFSLGMLKIIKGDDSGKDHRRSNKFIEEDSNDFTDKYFKSKQCSIGSGIGGITMFGSNELIGESRIAQINTIYDFSNNSTPNDSNADETKKKRATYFIDCVYNPIKRSYGKVGTFRKVNSNEYVDGDFRDMKILMYNDINDKIINITRCLQRFDTVLLFDTLSDITADRSKRITLSDKNNKGNPIETKDEEKDFVFRSLINGETNEEKMANIQSLNSGPTGDNLNDKTYSRLLESINSDERYKNSPAMKQRHLSIYSKVYGFRKRIDEILSMMRKQTKNDASLLFTIRVDEVIVKELRMILGYLAIVFQTFNIIQYEMKSGIYSKYLDQPSPPTSMDVITQRPSSSIIGIVNIFKLPHDDDTYNSNDEKRYLYGITYYFGGRPYESPPPKA